VGTRDALVGLGLRDADELVARASSWLDAEDRELRYGAAALIAEVLSDRITSFVTGGPALVAHAVWFATWLLINTGLLPLIEPFDTFPFPLLTLVVSLEAIFLTLFVLLSQNRMTARADKRAHLDLQIDMLAEREMTAVLRLLLDTARHLDVKLSLTEAQMADLVKKTDVRRITAELEKLPADGK